MTKIHARAFQNNYLKRIDLRAFNDNPIVKVTIGTGGFIESHRAFPGEPEDALKNASGF